MTHCFAKNEVVNFVAFQMCCMYNKIEACTLSHPCIAVTLSASFSVHWSLFYKTTPTTDHLAYETTRKYPKCQFFIVINLSFRPLSSGK